MRLDLDLYADQDLACWSESRELLVGGEEKGGKSNLLQKLAVIWAASARAEDPLHVHLLGQSETRIRRDHLEGLWAILAPLQRQGRVTYRHRLFVFWNLAQIHVHAWEKRSEVEALLSEPTHALLLDDVDQASPEVYQVALRAAAGTPPIGDTFPRIVAAATDFSVPWIASRWDAGVEGIDGGNGHPPPEPPTRGPGAFDVSRSFVHLRRAQLPRDAGGTLPNPLDQLPSPQPGPQEMARNSTADVVIMGGAAFGGKTWWLLTELLRHIRNPAYRFVAFRRTTPEIRKDGGMWERPIVEDAARVGLAVGVYSVPDVSGVALPVDATVNLLDGTGGEHIVAVKVTESNFDASTLCYLRHPRLSHLKIVQGWDPFLARALQEGPKHDPRSRQRCGVTSGPMSFAAHQYAHIFEAARREDWSEVNEAQNAVTAIFRSMQDDPAKFADLQRAKYIMGLGKPVMGDVSEDQVARVFQALESLTRDEDRQRLAKSLDLMEDGPYHDRLNDIAG